MRKHLALTAFACLIAMPSFAETPAHPAHKPNGTASAGPGTTTAVGTGVGIANSTSQSGAVAISGQGGQGGNSSLTVNNPANTTSTVNSNVSGTTTSNINQNVSGTTTQRIEQSGSVTSNVNQRVSGTQSIKNVPGIVGPSLAAAGLETCLGSASGGVSWLGAGVVGGSTYTDEGCQARLDSRTLFAYGLKAAAVARICQRPDIWRSMPDMCAQYWPRGVPYPSGVAAAYVEPAGLPVRALMSANGIDGGTIRVIDGRDGVEKDCLNYSAAKQKCFHWAGERPRKRVAAVNPTMTIAPAPRPKASVKPLAPETAVANSPAVQAIESATSGSPQ